MKLAEPLLTDPPLHLLYLPGRSDRLVLSFSGVGRPTEEIPDVEAAGMAGRRGENHVLFVIDASRSWMNGPLIVEKIEVALRVLVRHIKPSRIVAFGNSMGGSAALIFADRVPLDAILAVAPQYSIHPEIMPRENRWQDYARKITHWAYPKVPDLSGKPVQVVMLHGTIRREMMHVRGFVPGPNIHHYLFDGYPHGIAMRLKAKQKLDKIFTPLITGDIPASCRAAEEAGGQRYHGVKPRFRARAADLPPLPSSEVQP